MFKTGTGLPERKLFSGSDLEILQVDLVGNTFEGYSAGIGNRDAHDDIIMPGAFAKSIGQRVPAGKIKLLDAHSYWSARDLFGVVLEAEERLVTDAAQLEKENHATHRLWSLFKASQKEAAQEALQDIIDGILDGLSIGYRIVRVEFVVDDEDNQVSPELAWLRGQGVRKIHELQWWETSLVVWGANVEAVVIPSSVKALLDSMKTLEAKAVDEIQVRYLIRSLESLIVDQKSDSCIVGQDLLLHAAAAVEISLKRVEAALKAIPAEAREELEEVREELQDVTPSSPAAAVVDLGENKEGEPLKEEISDEELATEGLPAEEKDCPVEAVLKEVRSAVEALQIAGLRPPPAPEEEEEVVGDQKQEDAEESGLDPDAAALEEKDSLLDEHSEVSEDLRAKDAAERALVELEILVL